MEKGKDILPKGPATIPEGFDTEDIDLGIEKTEKYPDMHGVGQSDINLNDFLGLSTSICPHCGKKIKIITEKI